jgi:hypothetical protein
MNQWRHKLDASLPGDLRQIAEWIHRAEDVLARGLNFESSKLTPEENLHRFTQLNDEHNVGILIDFLEEKFVFFLGDFY